MNEIYLKFMDVLNHKQTYSKISFILRPRDKVFMNRTIRILMSQRNRIHHKALRIQNPLHCKKYRLRNKVID